MLLLSSHLLPITYPTCSFLPPQHLAAGTQSAVPTPRLALTVLVGHGAAPSPDGGVARFSPEEALVCCARAMALASSWAGAL